MSIRTVGISLPPRSKRDRKLLYGTHICSFFSISNFPNHEHKRLPKVSIAAQTRDAFFMAAAPPRHRFDFIMTSQFHLLPYYTSGVEKCRKRGKNSMKIIAPSSRIYKRGWVKRLKFIVLFSILRMSLKSSITC